jgi:hypothetical protein
MKILLVCPVFLILISFPHILLWADGEPQKDLYTAVDDCNRIKVDREYGYATDEQLNHSIGVVRQLLMAGANPNMRVPCHTALIPGYGVSFWHLDGEITLLMLSRVAEVSKLLIEYGARINEKDNYGRTALMIAAFLDNNYNDNNIITKLLLRNGANVNIQNNTGQTALHFAIYVWNIEAIELFIHNNVNVNVRDHKGWSPLIVANIRYYGDPKFNEEIAQILINAGATLSDSDIQLINDLKEKHIWWDNELNMNYSDR